MELNPGYKQTEIGLIPEKWDAEQIGNLLSFKNGLNKAKEFFGKGTPIVNYMDVFACPGLQIDDIQGRVTLSKAEIDRFDVRSGDVFFTRTSETVEDIGTAAVMLDGPKDTVFSGFVLRGRPIDSRMENSFKKYCFSDGSVRSQIVSTATYTTRALTNGRLLSNVWIALPPKAEQRAIAMALSDVDALLGGLDRLIGKKRNLKQAAMQQLLTGQTRLPGFEGEWEVKRLGELLSYEQPTKYLVSNSEYSDANDVPVLTAGKTFVLGYTSEEKGIFTSLPVIIFDDFTTASKFVTFPFKVKSSAMKLLGPRDPSMNFGLVYEIMQMVDFKLSEHKRYWISEYQKLEVRLPGSQEQDAIAAVLSDMDAELIALEQRRSKTRNLKQAMMQELLTGKTRLVTPGGPTHA